MLTVANGVRHPGSFGIRRPSRAVSLGDVREQPVQTMGLPQPGTDTDVWYYGGHGNPPIMQSSPGTEDDSGFDYQMELAWPEFAAAVEATAGTDDVNEWVATRPSDDPDAVEGAYGYPGFFEITADGKVREVAEPDRASGRNDPANPYWEELRGRLNPPEPVRDWGDEDSIMQGLSGEERALTGQTGGFMAAPSMASGPGGFSPPPQQLPNAGGFTRSPALSGPGGFARSPLPPFLNTIMAGKGESSPLGWLGGRAAEWEGRQTYEPGPSKRAYPGAPLMPREPVGGPHPSEVRRESLADRLREALAGYNPGRSYNGAPSLDAVGRAATSMLTSAGSTGHLGGPGQPFGSAPYRAPRGSLRDPGNPQSQMSQTMLADRFAQQAAQPQQGYFGGLGQAVGGMSTEQKIALLVGLGLLTGGTSTPLMAPALGVGAGLAFTQ